MGPVEEEEANRGGKVEGRLHPEDASPAGGAAVREGACSQDADKATNRASNEGKAVGKGAELEREDFCGYGLDDGDCAEGDANEDTATDKDGHRLCPG